MPVVVICCIGYFISFWFSQMLVFVSTPILLAVNHTFANKVMLMHKIIVLNLVTMLSMVLFGYDL
jgi:hypothetical protein